MAEELRDRLQTFRHGFGIQIYYNGEGSTTGRYAGDWIFNKKTGDCHMVYQDGSEYRGNLIDGVKNGRGLFVWPKEAGDSKSGHTYIGQWKDGKMHGKGRFLHCHEFVLEPTFVNNRALIDDGNFITPFMSQQEI